MKAIIYRPSHRNRRLSLFVITAITVFDIFEGGKLADDGKKSLALEVTLQPRDKTFTDAEIDSVAAKIIASVRQATGGEIRG